MSIDINAAIAMRRQEVFEQLDAANPSVEPIIEAMENELEYVFNNFFDNFDMYFMDNGVAVGSYEGLSEADEQFVFEWQDEFMKRAIRRWQETLADRAIETAVPNKAGEE